MADYGGPQGFGGTTPGGPNAGGALGGTSAGSGYGNTTGNNTGVGTTAVKWGEDNENTVNWGPTNENDVVSMDHEEAAAQRALTRTLNEMQQNAIRGEESLGWGDYDPSPLGGVNPTTGMSFSESMGYNFAGVADALGKNGLGIVASLASQALGLGPLASIALGQVANTYGDDDPDNNFHSVMANSLRTDAQNLSEIFGFTSTPTTSGTSVDADDTAITNNSFNTGYDAFADLQDAYRGMNKPDYGTMDASRYAGMVNDAVADGDMSPSQAAVAMSSFQNNFGNPTVAASIPTGIMNTNLSNTSFPGLTNEDPETSWSKWNPNIPNNSISQDYAKQVFSNNPTIASFGDNLTAWGNQVLGQMMDDGLSETEAVQRMIQMQVEGGAHAYGTAN